MSNIAEVFKNQKYILFNDVVSHEVCSLMTDYLFVKRDAGLLVPPVSLGGDDKQCPKSWSIYGDPLFDTLLARLAAPLSNLIGVSLIPAYTYSRIYQNGEVLEYHKDRPSCEISGTMTIGIKEGEPIWPIYVGKDDEDKVGKKIEIGLGEMMLYRGCEVPHWRPEYRGDWQAQVFFHYVDANGPYAQECKFDGRTSLGIPKTGNRTIVKKPWEESQELHSMYDNLSKKPWETTQEKKPLPEKFEFKVGE
jgi:hypothetical protein